MNENQHDRLIVDAGLQGGFHNGNCRLQAVDHMHAKALGTFPAGDCSHIASEIILNFMLQEVKLREHNVMMLRKSWCQRSSAAAVTAQAGAGSGIPPLPDQKEKEMIERTIASSKDPEPSQEAKMLIPRRADSLTNPFGEVVTILDIINHMKENRDHVVEGKFGSVRAAVETLGGRNRRSQVSRFSMTTFETCITSAPKNVCTDYSYR